MASDFLAREITDADKELARSWWYAHSEEEFPENLLPPVGVMIECDGQPVAACWLYMAVGVGVCWLEFPVSLPGLSLPRIRGAFAYAVKTLEAVALAHDYGVMMAHTLPPIARTLRGLGFRAEERHKVTMAKLLR